MLPPMSSQDAPSTLSVRIWTRSTWSGHTHLAPVSDLSKAVLGPQEQADASLLRFVSSYLKHAPASVLAGFSLPEPIEVVTVRVLVPRTELPRRLQFDIPIDISALLIPAGVKSPDQARDMWVIVPVLDHTFYVSKKEDLQDAIRSEVVRMAAVLKPEASDYLELFPAQEEALETLDIELSQDAGGLGDAKARRRWVRLKRDKQAQLVLESVARPLHSTGFVPGPAPVGLERDCHRLKTLMAGELRASVMLIGDARVGKSELLWSVLRAEGGGKRAVWATSGAQLIAGMSGLGQWQERVRRVMEAAETLDAIIYIDDVADLFGEQSHGIDIPSAMRPYIEEGRTRVIAEVRPQTLEKLEQRNAGFFAAFSRIRVSAQDASAAAEALRLKIEFHSKFDADGPQLSTDCIRPIIDLVDRYFSYQPFPAKALSLYESVRGLATEARDEDGQRPIVQPEQVLETFSLETGIPTFLLREDLPVKVSEIQAAFGKRVIGQQEAVQALVDTICVVKAALQPAGKPLATFLFVGPTGVGKTELARTLAEFLFGSEQRMVRFDMSEFADPLAAERLIRGSQTQEGLLTRRVRTQPFSVLLLDEIEKADTSVFDLLLQVLGEGRLTDTSGRITYFHNTIIVMTSNLGAAHRRDSLGFDAKDELDKRYYVDQVERSFRPEFVNRIDRIISFAVLCRTEVEAVIRFALQKVELRKGVVDRGLNLQVSCQALDYVAQEGYSAAYGARAVRRYLESAVVAPVASLLARCGAPAAGGTLWVGRSEESQPKARRVMGRLQAGDLEFVLFEGQQKQVKRDARHAARIAEMRRRMDRHLALDRVEQLKSQLQMVQAQLNMGGEGSAKQRKKKRKRDVRSSEDLARLRQEHHRMQGVLNKAQSGREALVVAEEVSLMALLSGDETVEYLQEAESADRGFQANLAQLLLAQEGHRDEATFAIQEVQPWGGFDLWLVPLLKSLEARGWQAELHIAGEAAKAGENWHGLSPWGPPRSVKTIIDHCQGAGRPLSGGLLLRVRGPYAGCLLALEQGLHRFEGRAKGGGSPGLFIQLVAMRYEFEDPKDWVHDDMAPLPDPLHSHHAKRKPIRRHQVAWDRIELSRADQTVAVPLVEYWARFEEIAVVELLAFERETERDRDRMFQGSLEGGGGVPL